ncbi:glycosyltransferase involved in cell wall biosynthesis [Natranaerovirga hydrolytica]|uniref:Glycosyltransferase involved in cell wall biosynthesis n=1 Tax=Natranaerovirga hydrolytica TaxID=680378 RepID=A0A4V2Q0B5_9FIRM|nr:glycosyltransferase [Natranaerovirga hydrolytica]TCK93141.1 glycosyltransferase involved in cell wall biosynthesis [Natranaerovirga hydrolytica]
MKIAYLLSHVPGPRFYKKIKKAKETFEVSVIFRNRKAENFQTFFRDNDINKYELMSGDNQSQWLRVNIYLSFYKKSIAKLKEISPDIIHCGNLDMLFLTYMYKRKYDDSVKIVYEIGDLNKRTFNNSKRIDKYAVKKGLIFLEKKLFNSVDQLIISSQHFWDDYYRDFVSAEKTFLFPNAPEKTIFDNVKEIKKESVTIGFVGRIRYHKQLNMLIDAVAKINQQSNKHIFNVLIAGEGPESDIVKEYAKDFDFVTMYGPYNYDEEIAEIYSMIDIVYSVYDASIQNVKVAIPNRLYEAIVAMRPIIVAKDTKLGEFVEKNQIGFAVSSRLGSTELFDLLNRVYLNTDAMIDIKQKCNLIKNNYYIESYQASLIDMYKKTLQ